ncbi:698_t:CDS:2 [Ambispora gerdemannii]|uniref:698_t:CDS:1 n=1 Tax=Ambispora gerdemannii TaxID=144530 RepID=A0A9N9BYP5_9GLOM|nr:698_t:CDS:2 [Ambispora gerdemannii]
METSRNITMLGFLHIEFEEGVRTIEIPKWYSRSEENGATSQLAYNETDSSSAG